MNCRTTALLLALLPLSCAPETLATTRPNVILVCMDTVRADHLGCYGYEQRDTTPFLDGLAEESLLFENASATACWTKPSVPSILTGTLPLQHGVYRGSARDEAGSFSDVLPEEATTLAEAFQGSGYQTAAFVRNAQLRAGLGFEQGFETYRDRAGDARQIRWQARDWLEERDGGRPFFLYLHFLDAHWPYAVPEEYASLNAEPEVVERIRSGDWRAMRRAVNDGEQELSEVDREGLIGLYDASIRYMDDELARLWQHIEDQGLAQDTIICVVSDHGEEFLEHGKLGHGHGLYENLLEVPWILHVPGRASARVRAQVSLLDLYPTLLSAAGIEGQLEGLLGVDRLFEPELGTPAIAEHLDPRRYHVSWKEDGRKQVEIVEPAKPSVEAASSLAQLDTRGRWEARLRRAEDGQRWLLRLRRAKDQEEQQVELKGVVEELGQDSLRIAGVSVDTSAAPELYGNIVDAEGRARGLEAGRMVKVRGDIVGDGLRAQKIKLYGDDEELELELRGPLHVLDPQRVSLGGVALRVAEDLELDLGELDNDLEPALVVELYAGRAQLVGRETLAYDLLRDLTESAPLEAQPTILEAGPRLQLLRGLAESRLWGEGGGRRLSAAEMADLRAIGYAE